MRQSKEWWSVWYSSVLHLSRLASWTSSLVYLLRKVQRVYTVVANLNGNKRTSFFFFIGFLLSVYMRIHGLLSVLTSCMTAYVTAIYPCRNFVFPVSWCTTRCILVFPVSYVPLDVCILVYLYNLGVCLYNPNQRPLQNYCNVEYYFREKVLSICFQVICW